MQPPLPAFGNWISMRKVTKYIFYIGSLLLWLMALAAALELYARWQLRSVETKNPFVLSRIQGEKWPIPDAQSNAFSDWLLDGELRTQYRSKGKSVTPLPPVSPEWERNNREALYNDLDAFGKEVFKNLYRTDADVTENTSGIVDVTQDKELWKEPHFLYRKHVRKKDHVNVLGLAEDFYSNNHGFRDADFPVEKTPGVFRIENSDIL